MFCPYFILSQKNMMKLDKLAVDGAPVSIGGSTVAVECETPSAMQATYEAGGDPENRRRVHFHLRGSESGGPVFTEEELRAQVGALIALELAVIDEADVSADLDMDALHEDIADELSDMDRDDVDSLIEAVSASLSGVCVIEEDVEVELVVRAVLRQITDYMDVSDLSF